MSLQYESKNIDVVEENPIITTTTTSQEPQARPEPAVLPPQEGIEYLKRTQEHPNELLAKVEQQIEQTLQTWNATKEPSEAELQWKEKERKAALYNSYAWTGVKVAACIFLVALAISYLRMAKVANLNALKA